MGLNLLNVDAIYFIMFEGTDCGGLVECLKDIEASRMFQMSIRSMTGEPVPPNLSLNITRFEQ